MDVEIKFGGGRTDTVKVHFDDDPYDLAEDFVDKHQLKQSYVKVIAKYIRESIEQYLAEESVQYNDSFDANDFGGGRSRKSEDTYYRESTATYRESDRCSVPSESEKYSEHVPPSNHSNVIATHSQQPQPLSSQPPAIQQPPPMLQALPVSSQHVSPTEIERRSPATPSPSNQGLPPMHPPSSHREQSSTSSDNVQKPSISKLSSESPSVPITNSATSVLSSAVTSRSRLNSGEPYSYSNRTRQNSLSSSVGLMRKNSDDWTPNRYSVRSPEYYLEPHNDDDSAFDRGAHRRNSETTQFREVSSEYSPRRDDSNVNSPFEKIVEGNEHSITDARLQKNNGNTNNNPETENDDNGNEEDEEANMFRNLRDQVHNDESEEDEEALLYEQLQRGNNSKTFVDGLKPVCKSLEMGKKSMLPNAPGMSNPSELNRQKKGIVGKSASERLHHTAELMRRKKEMLSKKAEAESKKKLEETKFQLNRHSQEITEKMGSRYKDGDIAAKLYQEGVKATEERKSKEIEVQKIQESIIRDWSCVKCGTFHTISSAAANALKWSKKEYACSKCHWVQQEVQTFKPTNVGLSLNEEGEEFLKARRNLVVEEGKGNVHEYLYHTGMQREKILHFNRELWDEIDAQMPFAPTIPESSKRILSKYQRSSNNGNESSASSITESYNVRDDMSGLSLSTHFRFHSRLSGPALQEYLNRPTVERLVNTQTRSAMDEAILRDMMNPQPVSSSLSTVDERKKFVDRLVYEYKDKNIRQQKEEKRRYASDPFTGQKLFQPRVPDIPDEIRSGRSVSTGKGGPIWEKLVEKNKETEKKKLRIQKKAVEDTLKELRDNQVKALPISNEILQESTDKNLEELYRLLLACNEDGVGAEIDDNNTEENLSLLNENNEENNPQENEESPLEPASRFSPTIEVKNARSSSPSNIPKINTKRIHMISQRLENWKERRLDLAAVQPMLMINEVSTLLLDMKKCLLTQRKKQGESDVPLFITFMEFKKLAMKCIRFRNGPGKGYIFAPKKRPEVALQLQKEQLLEETFRPEIDRHSQEISKGRQEAYRQVAIEDLLQADGEKLKKRLECEREKKKQQENEVFSFQPILYKPPASVTPKYRGMDLDALDAAIELEENDDIIEKRFDDEEDNPIFDIPVSLAHKVQTLQNSAAPVVVKSQNTRTQGHNSHQSARSKMSANAPVNNGNEKRSPLGNRGANHNTLTKGIQLQTPVEVRFSRFSLPLTEKNDTAQVAGAQKNTSAIAYNSGELEAKAQHTSRKAVTEQEERDENVFWGVAPKDVISSTQGSTKHPQQQQQFKVDARATSPRKSQSPQEAALPQAQDSHHRLPPFPHQALRSSSEEQNRYNHSFSSSPSMSTITTELVHDDNDEEDMISGALLLSRRETKPIRTNVPPEPNGVASSVTGSSTGRNQSGYLHRMKSSQSNRSMLSNHSLMVSNNSSFLSHAPLQLQQSPRTTAREITGGNSLPSKGVPQSAPAMTMSAGLSSNSKVKNGPLDTPLPPPPPPPPPMVTPQHSKGSTKSKKVVTAPQGNPSRPPPLPIELQQRQLHSNGKILLLFIRRMDL
jgi:hypothetical protein